MKLIIELHVEDTQEAEMLLAESKKATGINVEVGRASYKGKVHGFGRQDPAPARVFRVSSSVFQVRS